MMASVLDARSWSSHHNAVRDAGIQLIWEGQSRRPAYVVVIDGVWHDQIATERRDFLRDPLMPIHVANDICSVLQTFIWVGPI